MQYCLLQGTGSSFLKMGLDWQTAEPNEFLSVKDLSFILNALGALDEIAYRYLIIRKEELIA